MIFEKIQNILAEQFEVPADSITLGTNFVEDLGADSLDVVEVVMSIEDMFGLAVPDEAVAELTTVEKLVEFIEANR